LNSLTEALNDKNDEIINYLLKDYGYDPSRYNNSFIQRLCHYNKPDILKMILEDPRVDPSADGNECINKAVKYNLLDMVKILLDDPRVDPSINGYEGYNPHKTIKSAIENQNIEIIKELAKNKNMQIGMNMSESELLDYLIK
jgi:hypothetical protein